MRNRDIIGWSKLLRLLLDDIDNMERDRCDHEDEDGYLLDEIDEAYKGIATNGFGVGIDFDEIRKAENMYEAENIDE